MNIILTDVTHGERGSYFEMSNGKSQMIVGASTIGGTLCVSTLVLNASNRAYRKLGRSFYGPAAWNEAMAAYKSGECQAMIEFVRSETAKKNS